MTKALAKLLKSETLKLRQAGLYRETDPATLAAESADIDLTGQDYLGLSEHPRLREAAVAHLTEAPSISGPDPIQRELEQAVAGALQLPDAMAFSSGYMANLAAFTALFDHRDMIFCETSAHPSVGEGIRLSGAQAMAYDLEDMNVLEDGLKRSKGARFRVIAVDGVSAIRGEVAPLGSICDLADRYDAVVAVDDALGVGVLGETGGGSIEAKDVQDRVHIVTGSFSKALGTAGGFVAAHEGIIDWMRQKAVPGLWSSRLPGAMAAAARASLELLAEDAVSEEASARDHLMENVEHCERALTDIGFRLLGSGHPCMNVWVGEVLALQRITNQLHESGILAHGLCFPIVPEHEARLRLQISAVHTPDELDKVVSTLESAAKAQKVI